MKKKWKAALGGLALCATILPISLAGCGTFTEETQKAIIGTWLQTEHYDNGSESWVAEGTASVYFEEGISEQRKAEIGEEIKKLDNVKSCVYYSRDDRVRQYAEMTGTAKTEFQNWDIPEEYEIMFQDVLQYVETIEEIEQISGVDSVISEISGYVFYEDGTVREFGCDNNIGIYTVEGNKVQTEIYGYSAELEYNAEKLSETWQDKVGWTNKNIYEKQ